jgi:hypothetical protein
MVIDVSSLNSSDCPLEQSDLYGQGGLTSAIRASTVSTLSDLRFPGVKFERLLCDPGAGGAELGFRRPPTHTFSWNDRLDGLRREMA